MANSPADWQLPPGASRGLWDYLHDADLARNYDAALSDSPLLKIDMAVAERWFPSPGRLLDLGCGTGRLLIPFARKNFQVVGVDLSEPMLAVARQKAAVAGVPVQLLKANIVDLGFFRDETFHYA